MSETLEQLKVVCGPSVSTLVTDEELMQQFLHEEESTAFTELMRRHGSMVFGVCRRILGQHQDTEDAFQAVFLVLAQQIHSQSPPRKLAAWLHGVASRTALKVLSKTQRNRASSFAEVEAICHDQDPITTEWLTMLDEELEQLPEKYRVPMLLCGLQGRSRREVAALLNCPEGTIAGRVRRGKQRLAERLAKRGVILSIATLTLELSNQCANARVPTMLLASTSHLVKVSQLGEVGNSFVHTLAEGVLQTMTMSKWKVAACWLVFISFIFGLGYMGPNLANAENQTSKSKKGKPRDVEPIRPELVLQQQVQRELRLSQNQIQQLQQAWESGKNTDKAAIAESKKLQQQLEQLAKQMNKVRAQMSKVDSKIRQSQSAKLKQAILDKLSNHALERLRQLTLREQGTTRLLFDPKIQAKLNINDEQLKKLEKIKDGSSLSATLELGFPKVPYQLKEIHGTLAIGLGQEIQFYHQFEESEILKILTPEQFSRLKKMLGDPFPRHKSEQSISR